MNDNNMIHAVVDKSSGLIKQNAYGILLIFCEEKNAISFFNSLPRSIKKGSEIKSRFMIFDKIVNNGNVGSK